MPLLKNSPFNSSSDSDATWMMSTERHESKEEMSDHVRSSTPSQTDQRHPQSLDPMDGRSAADLINESAPKHNIDVLPDVLGGGGGVNNRKHGALVRSEFLSHNPKSLRVKSTCSLLHNQNSDSPLKLNAPVRPLAAGCGGGC